MYFLKKKCSLFSSQFSRIPCSFSFSTSLSLLLQPSHVLLPSPPPYFLFLLFHFMKTILSVFTPVHDAVKMQVCINRPFICIMDIDESGGPAHSLPRLGFAALSFGRPGDRTGPRLFVRRLTGVVRPASERRLLMFGIWRRSAWLIDWRFNRLGPGLAGISFGNDVIPPHDTAPDRNER